MSRMWFGLAALALAACAPVEGDVPPELGEYAVEVDTNLYWLGESWDVDGRLVEGWAFVTPTVEYAKGGVKGKPGGGGGTTCYGHLAKGAYWKSVEDWKFWDNDSWGMGGSAMMTDMDDGITAWEAAATVDIVGSGTSGTGLSVDSSSPDGANEVLFGSASSGTLAYTVVWGIFGGKPANRELVEWDMLFNDDVPWSLDATDSSYYYDFPSIAIHELGHTVGMDDLYDSACVDETMYGYGAPGETYARDLNTGDIAGVYDLYN